MWPRIKGICLVRDLTTAITIAWEEGQRKLALVHPDQG